MNLSRSDDRRCSYEDKASDEAGRKYAKDGVLRDVFMEGALFVAALAQPSTENAVRTLQDALYRSAALAQQAQPEATCEHGFTWWHHVGNKICTGPSDTQQAQPDGTSDEELERRANAPDSEFVDARDVLAASGTDDALADRLVKWADTRDAEMTAAPSTNIISVADGGKVVRTGWLRAAAAALRAKPALADAGKADYNVGYADAGFRRVLWRIGFRRRPQTRAPNLAVTMHGFTATLLKISTTRRVAHNEDLMR